MAGSRVGKSNTGGSKEKKPARRRSGSKAVSTRRKGTKRPAEENEIPDALFTEIGILFLLAFCIILILGNFGLTLRFGDVFNSLFFGIFGGMEYLFPFCLFAFVCFYLVNKENLRAVIKLISACILFFDAGMFLQLFISDDYNLGGYSGTYDYSMSNRSGGGVLSGGLFEVLQKNIGRPATVIIMVIVLLICILAITGNSLFRLLSYPGSEIADRAKESRREREKDREAIREEREKIRAEEREERSRKRAEEREEKRRKFRENSKKKKDRSFVFLTVGDDKMAGSEENSYLQNDVYSYEHEREAAESNKNTVTESQGYSPFAMDPAHMIKPKDFDKKSEPKAVPEIRLREKEQASEADFPAGIALESGPQSGSEPEAISGPEPEPQSWPEPEPDFRKEERFYEELMHSHEAESSDMHEITFDDDIAGEYTDAEKLPEIEEFTGAGEFAAFGEMKEEKLPEIEEYSETDELTAFKEMTEEKLPEIEESTGTEELTAFGEMKEEKLPDTEDFFDTVELTDIEELRDEDLPDIEESTGTEELPDIEELTGTDELSGIEELTDSEALSDTEEMTEGEEPEPEKTPEKPYELPPVDLLKRGVAGTKESEGDLRETAAKLQGILASFGVKVRMLNFIQGPTVTRFEMQPEQGVKVNTILNLANDIQMNLAARDIRIEAPIPGKAAVGIEIPNKKNSPVMLRELIESEAFRNAKSKITIAVGKDIGGEAVVYDIDKMPHLLIAGATGSGKSVCINTLIMSLLYRAKPDEVKLIMIDPKVVELSIYNGIPHLLTPVVTDPVKAAGALNWGVQEMMKRYQLFARAHVRNMEGYNEKVPELNKAGETLIDGSPYEILPQIVIIVDELADLMMVQKKDVEASICRLAQLARAAGIHLIIATQRPSVDVITGLIKANMPSRVAFAVSSNVDSRTILDSAGAEKLLGNGDMLFYPQKYPKPERLQGAFVSDEEVQAVTDFIRAETAPKDEDKDISAEIEAAAANTGSDRDGGDEAVNPQDIDDGRDSYFADAGRFVTEKGKATIGVLQRMFRIGFNRAARIMDQLAEAGVVSGEDGTKPRQVLMTKEEFEAFLSNESEESEAEDED